jgi:hypothetical protein
MGLCMSRVLTLTAVLLLIGLAAQAQLQTGNLYGTVVDDQGGALPGVTVTLDCGAAPGVQVTDGQGRFRFPGLSPGNCSLKAELDGFSTVDYPNVVVNVGRNTNMEVAMSPQ